MNILVFLGQILKLSMELLHLGGTVVVSGDEVPGRLRFLRVDVAVAFAGKSAPFRTEARQEHVLNVKKREPHGW